MQYGNSNRIIFITTANTKSAESLNFYGVGGQLGGSPDGKQ